jgi:CDP-diacylglycerol--glycerol-3-phosphate 3-phosphatidyltransferase
VSRDEPLIVEGVDHMADPVQPVSVWNVANALTMLRLFLVPVFAYLLLSRGPDAPISWRIAALAVFLIASITDSFDGELARRRGLITDFGKIADPIADKALIGAALIGLSVLGELSWWITAVVLGRELGVTLLRFWVIRHGVIPASRGGKLKTALQIAAISLYILPLTGWLHVLAVIVMAAAVLVTVVTGVDYVVRAIRLRRNSARTAMKKARREADRRDRDSDR